MLNMGNCVLFTTPPAGDSRMTHWKKKNPLFKEQVWQYYKCLLFKAHRSRQLPLSCLSLGHCCVERRAPELRLSLHGAHFTMNKDWPSSRYSLLFSLGNNFTESFIYFKCREARACRLYPCGSIRHWGPTVQAHENICFV